MRRVIAAAVALLALVALAACGPAEEGGAGGKYEVVHVDVDGRQVPCVIWDGDRAGGVTCDWQR